MIRPSSSTDARLRSDGRKTSMLRRLHLAALDNADRLTGAARTRFLDLVGSINQRIDVGGIGVMPIQVDAENHIWEPVEFGTAALIVPVRESRNRCGAPLVDLLAWRPSTGAVYTITDMTDVLGWDHLDPVFPDAPVVLHPDVGAWCRASGNGLVVINLSRVRGHLGHLPAIVVNDIATGRRLRTALTPPAPRLPCILVETSNYEVAA